LLIELVVGLALAALAVAIRYALTPFIGETAPYVFVFAGVTVAAVVAGWRGGLIAMIAGQALTMYAIIRPAGMFYLDSSQAHAGLLVATLSQLILLAAIAFYQREVDKGTAERDKRMALLDEALKEIDHRTRNNYQVVLALVDLQARRATDDNVRDALRQVTERIDAIARASQQLAVRSAELGTIRLDDHLCGLVRQIDRGLSREEIDVECDVEEVTASADKATSISIIVNELVTNAIKHAFNGEQPGHVWVTGRSGSEFELIVADDGRGIDSAGREGRSGLGTKLVESFARQLGAKHDVSSSDKGTTHRLMIPSLE
jgi:two-component sensor histidine kinase